MNVSTSIGDFPLFKSVENSFQQAKSAGVDGIEFIMGFKSRWNFSEIIRLSKKYELPITSIHQPYWSGLGIAYDEAFISLAMQAGITNIVFHPLCFQSMENKRMHHYFTFLSLMQKKYGIHVMLENMPYEDDFFSLDRWVLHNNTSELESIFSVAQNYNFSLTYDVSHIKWTHPDQHNEFKKIFPSIANIHLSSFDDKQQHLPLNMGDFDTKSFITFLMKHDYKGLVTFEIFYPKQFPLFSFNWEVIRKSLDIIHSIYKS